MSRDCMDRGSICFVSIPPAVTIASSMGAGAAISSWKFFMREQRFFRFSAESWFAQVSWGMFARSRNTGIIFLWRKRAAKFFIICLPLSWRSWVIFALS